MTGSPSTFRMSTRGAVANPSNVGALTYPSEVPHGCGALVV